MSYFVLPVLLLTNVSCSGLITSVGEVRPDFSAVNYSQFLWCLFEGGFLFLLVLRIGCIILGLEYK